MDKAQAQISVLKGLIERSKLRGEGELGETEMNRELEMVGLRERTILSRGIPRDEMEGKGVPEFEELRDVGWREVIFGQRRKATEKDEKKEVEEWAKGEVHVSLISLFFGLNGRKGL